MGPWHAPKIFTSDSGSYLGEDDTSCVSGDYMPKDKRFVFMITRCGGDL